jgi:hypothetical protein
MHGEKPCELHKECEKCTKSRKDNEASASDTLHRKKGITDLRLIDIQIEKFSNFSDFLPAYR